MLSAPKAEPFDREAALEAFDMVWSTVKEKHWDTALVGESWTAARDELRPQIEVATDQRHARALMNELLGRLKLSHFNIIPADAYDDIGEGEASDDDGWSGIDMRLIEGALTATRVRIESPAYTAGVRSGWSLVTAGNTEASRVLEIVSEASGIYRPETMAAEIANAILSGNVGDTLSTVWLDGDNRSVTVDIVLVEIPGEIARFGELPPTPVEVERRTLESGVGYFRLSVFFAPEHVLSEWRAFLDEHREAPGIIVDLRGNPGGIILMSSGMTNWLVTERGLTAGTMQMRDEIRGVYTVPLVINPRANPYDGPVAVLIDESSISNSEILAAALKDNGVARVFGRRTAGLVLPATARRLPTGDRFLYAFASLTTAGGYALEGTGVTPDVEIALTRQMLLDGEDPDVAAAVEWILTNDE